MVFSSAIFLLGFLPIALTLYYLTPKQAKNSVLLSMSLFFYAWGEIYYVLLMIVSIASNYCLGLMIGRCPDKPALPNKKHEYRGEIPSPPPLPTPSLKPVIASRGRPRRKKTLLCAGIVVNLALLSTFKYSNFIVEQINQGLTLLKIPPIDLSPVHLPLGISFFTFQAISYLVDVYRNQTPAQRNIVRLALFVSFFPQLIAGPIIRYKDIARQIYSRIHRLSQFENGVQRFILGLSKKLLVANPLGQAADGIFALPAGELSLSLGWIGIVCYTLQIYFDFSGYSDMAIGLGRMFGFHFPENFRYPYMARSIREFWRRWHISLSTWFRDYLYIPLGGNQAPGGRVYVNLLIVFFLCGLWHGASWNFVIWGLLHGFFITLERIGLEKGFNTSGWMKPITHLYTLLVVITAWVFFRAETIPDALGYLSAMYGVGGVSFPTHPIALFVTRETLLALGAGLIFAMPVYPFIAEKLKNASGENSAKAVLLYYFPKGVLLCTLLFLSLVKTASSTYNPFIYFRF